MRTEGEMGPRWLRCATSPAWTCRLRRAGTARNWRHGWSRPRTRFLESEHSELRAQRSENHSLPADDGGFYFPPVARMSFDEKIARLKETAARKVAESKGKNASAIERQLKLELWPDDVRGVPNAILRGALFGIGQERAVHKKRTLIAAVEGYEIRFKGDTFNQTDLDVLEGMLHAAMPHPLGKRVEFSVHAFLKALGLWNEREASRGVQGAGHATGDGWD